MTSDGLVEHTEGGLDPTVHLWRACAYGQRHRWLAGMPGDRDGPRAVALAAVRRVVALVPDPTNEVRVLLRRLLEPSQGADDDLVDFAEDEDCRAAIGRG